MLNWKRSKVRGATLRSFLQSKQRKSNVSSEVRYSVLCSLIKFSCRNQRRQSSSRTETSRNKGKTPLDSRRECKSNMNLFHNNLGLTLNFFLQENRIKELKQAIETERKRCDDATANGLAEHKKLQQKLTSSEKEIQKLQEVIKIHENEIEKLQEKNQQCESDLKEAEQMKNTIMQLMQGRTFRK